MFSIATHMHTEGPNDAIDPELQDIFSQFRRLADGSRVPAHVHEDVATMVAQVDPAVGECYAVLRRLAQTR